MLRAVFARYRLFLREPDVARLLGTAVLTRMPLGTVGFSLLMHVRAITDSFAIAGATVGTYLAASAITAPMLGRLIDRRGPRVPLIVLGIVCPLALLVLLGARVLALSNTLLFIAAAVAGGFAPPITALFRTIWRHRFVDEDLRRTAYALDSVLVELAFTIGPALIGMLLAIATPTVALAVACAFMALAVPSFLVSPALDYWQQEAYSKRELLGPLTDRRLWVVYGATFFLAFSLGSLEVAYPGFATATGTPALAGMLLAVNSAGSVLGGLAFGGLHVRLPFERQLRWSAVLLALALSLQIPVASIGVLGVLAFAAGLCIAPTLSVATMLVSLNAPSRYTTEAFTWSFTFIVAGVGGGMALGGQLLERVNANAVFALASGVALLAAVFALALRSRRDGHALK